MKKFIAVALSAGLIIGAFGLPADAAKKKKKKKKKPVRVERVAEGNYIAPATAAGLCGQQDAVACVTFPTGPKESYVSAEVTDAHGQPVAVAIKADKDGDATSETLYGTFCGSTEAPIKVDPGVTLIFWVGLTVDTAPTGCAPGEATQGTINVTHSNMR